MNSTDPQSGKTGETDKTDIRRYVSATWPETKPVGHPRNSNHALPRVYAMPGYSSVAPAPRPTGSEVDPQRAAFVDAIVARLKGQSR